jgi:hypothetical protein
VEDPADHNEQQHKQADRHEQRWVAKAVGHMRRIAHSGATFVTSRQLTHAVALRPASTVDRPSAQHEQGNNEQCRQWYYPKPFP